MILPAFTGLQTLFYMVLGVRLLIRFNKYIRSEASNYENKYIRWLASLEGLLLMPVFSVIILILWNGPEARGVARSLPYPGIVVSIMMIALGVIALVKPDFLQGLPEALRVDKGEDLHPQRYESSSLLEDSKQRYHRQLMSYMKEHRPFLELDLTLSELSRRLGINTKYLSQVINEVEGKNFMDFINQYRIERAKEMLLSPAFRNYTIIAIAQEVGFKSKSAFYNAFKKFTGHTPSGFKQAQQQGEILTD